MRPYLWDMRHIPAEFEITNHKQRVETGFYNWQG